MSKDEGAACGSGGGATERDEIVRETRRWVEEVVIALGLCPFAGHVLASGQVGFDVVDGDDEKAALTRLAEVAQRLAVDARADATELIILAEGFADFADYLQLLDLSEALLVDLSLDQHVQIASFHPDYVFEGEAADDPANATNRSPWPILHLLRESSVTRAVESHPDVEGIPARNIARLREHAADGADQLTDRAAHGRVGREFARPLDYHGVTPTIRVDGGSGKVV